MGSGTECTAPSDFARTEKRLPRSARPRTMQSSRESTSPQSRDAQRLERAAGRRVLAARRQLDPRTRSPSTVRARGARGRPDRSQMPVALPFLGEASPRARSGRAEAASAVAQLQPDSACAYGRTSLHQLITGSLTPIKTALGCVTTRGYHQSSVEMSTPFSDLSVGSSRSILSKPLAIAAPGESSARMR